MAHGSVPTSCSRVLLVEDDADTREVFAMLLQALGFHVSAAPGAEEALASCADCDLALVDLGLSGMTGYELAPLLRKGGVRRLIAVSGHSREQDLERCSQVGFDGYVGKPVNLAALQVEIARVCGP